MQRLHSALRRAATWTVEDWVRGIQLFALVVFTICVYVVYVPVLWQILVLLIQVMYAQGGIIAVLAVLSALVPGVTLMVYPIRWGNDC